MKCKLFHLKNVTTIIITLGVGANSMNPHILFLKFDLDSLRTVLVYGESTSAGDIICIIFSCWISSFFLQSNICLFRRSFLKFCSSFWFFPFKFIEGNFGMSNSVFCDVIYCLSCRLSDTVFFFQIVKWD